MNLFNRMKEYFKHRAMSITQAFRYVEAMKDQDLKEEAKKKDMPITISAPEQRKKFLRYCISLCPDKRSKIIMELVKVYGFTYEQIAWFLRKNGFGATTPEEVKRVEQDGIKRVKDAIARQQDKGVPIVGN